MTRVYKGVRYLCWIGLLLITCSVIMIFYANWAIPHSTQNYLFDDVEKIPKMKVALVLGTTPYLVGGGDNPYFTYRIQAAKELYDAGKVESFIVSGDNATLFYNEPIKMQKALIKQGIPKEKIFLDYAGFRTLDSVVRANKIFQQDAFIVVSQKFHNERAVYLSRYYGVDAYGYNAKDLDLNRFSIKTKLREKLARVKVFIDILFRIKPRFLGETIDLE